MRYEWKLWLTTAKRGGEQGQGAAPDTRTLPDAGHSVRRRRADSYVYSKSPSVYLLITDFSLHCTPALDRAMLTSMHDIPSSSPSFALPQTPPLHSPQAMQSALTWRTPFYSCDHSANIRYAFMLYVVHPRNIALSLVVQTPAGFLAHFMNCREC